MIMAPLVQSSFNMEDLINKPGHYTKDLIESIDYIKQQLGDKFPYYLEGHVIRYMHRHKYKQHTIQDLKKAEWYLKRLIKEYEVNE